MCTDWQLQATKMAFKWKMLLVSLCLAELLPHSQSPSWFALAATDLPPDEVVALKNATGILGKPNWNYTVDACSGLDWLRCDCFVKNSTFCHVSSIFLKESSLGGTLPRELYRLPYLQFLDLTGNYISGPIPPQWGSTKLVSIVLLKNRISGSIPTELANISTLQTFQVGYNKLSGNIPSELGNLIQLKRLHFGSNNFTGGIPATFAALTQLQHFRINDNNLYGKIPNFIEGWTNLSILTMQGSGLSGPIPAQLSALHSLSDLRISDLKGSNSTFPQLNNNLKLNKLVLRSCNIVGSLPDYLGRIPNLTIVDLSFNKLSGEIPTNFILPKVENLYLTGNLLSGPVPAWILKNANYVDLSYNNFNISNLENLACEQQRLNLFASSSNDNHSGFNPCLGNCPRIWYSFHINCGGEEVNINGSKIYDEDTDPGGPATLFWNRKTNWVFSNTGVFMDGDDISKVYTIANVSVLSMADSELYRSARISPLSLTYYGFCLGNGNYSVNLHFAEIGFTDDETYRSLERRVFDIYIQGKLVQKDFDITAEAGGFGKAVTKKYTAMVNSNALEIRFHWAGKGSTSIPQKGVYGPLISAISVDPDFTPPLESGSHVPAGTVIASVVVGLVILIIMLSVLLWRCCPRKKTALEKEMKNLDLQTNCFTLRQITAATNNFDIAYKIGEGGFGPVYKGILSDGTIVAVKQLSSNSRQGNREFINEIGMISAQQHPFLVKLYGCCVEGNQPLLVYEYMENNSLARALFGPEECQLKLDWPTRQKICVGIAKGLAFLHEESRQKIIHRDIKSTNVLLDKDLNPKISDFGLAKLHEGDRTHISTRIAGTFGYMAPEYAMHGYLTKKADVYSFGIVVLEIISGRTNTTHQSIHQSDVECFYLRDWAHILKNQGELMELIDPKLGVDFNEAEVMVMINVALLCTSNSPIARPTMSSVVGMLEGKPIVEEVVPDETEMMGEIDLEIVKNNPLQKEEKNKVESGTSTLLCHGIPTTSSKSFSDLCPVDKDSFYWEKMD